MGKGKPSVNRHSRRYFVEDEQAENALPSAAFDAPHTRVLKEAAEGLEVEEVEVCPRGLPSKYQLYQRSVQSPKGDISYLLKFFLTYIGSRPPVHLREDFCGTALICAEWVKGGIQRMATGLDLDREALRWGYENNFMMIGADARTRVCLLHGNVLNPISAADQIVIPAISPLDIADGVSQIQINRIWSAVDIICALNYSCCCLHRRLDLVNYFKYVQGALRKGGGIFAMDLYGGVSSLKPLKLSRHFSDFTYIWEQGPLNITDHMTKISLHFRMKNSRMLRHAFTYSWRLWTLPELRDCLEEAGFDSVHFWICEMDIIDKHEIEDEWKKYEELKDYPESNAWNAYIVAVVHAK